MPYRLIPQTPNRKTTFLSADISACNPVGVEQVAEPGTILIVLCRTPPDTDTANTFVISNAHAVTTWKTSE